jgi:type VI secretion system secreted protein VgrG
MSTTQDGRLLRIDSTAFDKDYLLLNELQFTEEISELFYCNVQLLHGEDKKDFEPTDIDATAILGQNVTITLKQSDGTTRTLNGIVNSFSRGDRDARFSYYQATIVPKVWLLTQVIQCRIFQHKSVLEIVKEVLEDFDFSMQVQGEFKPRDYCVQYRESDFQFISRIMEEEGIYFYFEHSDTNHKMILANTPTSHKDAPTKNVITYVVELDDDKKFVPRINNLWTGYKLQIGQVAYRDFHFQKPTDNLEIQQPSFYPVANNQNLELYDYPGGYARKYDGIDRMGGESPGGFNGIFPDKQRTVKNTMNALDSQYNVLSGTGNCCSLIAGYKFKLIKHPNKKLNAQYIISSITHEAHQSPNYHSDEEVGEPYNNQFEIIPYGQGVPPYCPPRKIPKPVIEGCQTAMVVGPSGEEIFTDKYGRVKVQFHWDRHGKEDAGSSCWVRVAQLWASNGWGSMFIPRIGTEVIVQFVNGDLDNPIITGCVYNAETMPAYTLPDEKTKSGIKTNSSKGGNGFNELRFEDKKGKEQIFIHGEKDFDLRIKNDRKEIVKNDRHLIVENNQHEKVKKDKHLKVGGDKNEEVTGTVSLKTQKIQNKVGQNYGLDAGSEVHIKGGMTTVVEAGTSLTLKVGGNFININSGGIFIKGKMVMLNSGGMGGSGSGASPDPPEEPKEADDAKAGKDVKTKKNPPPPKPKEFSELGRMLASAAKNATPFVEP